MKAVRKRVLSPVITTVLPVRSAPLSACMAVVRDPSMDFMTYIPGRYDQGVCACDIAQCGDLLERRAELHDGSTSQAYNAG